MLPRSLPSAAIWVFLLAACSKAPVAVLDLSISKGDWTGYDQSLQMINARQTPEERTEFAQALQELKYQAMAAGHQPGPAVNAAVHRKIAGLTVRDVLVLGQTIKETRKLGEEQALLRSIRMNRRRRARPGDTESAAYLVSFNADQDKQLAKLRAEIATIGKRLDELSPTRDKPPVVVVASELDEPPVSAKHEAPPVGR